MIIQLTTFFCQYFERKKRSGNRKQKSITTAKQGLFQHASNTNPHIADAAEAEHSEALLLLKHYWRHFE
jgi:hypothetical protein